STLFPCTTLFRSASGAGAYDQTPPKGSSGGRRRARARGFASARGTPLRAAASRGALRRVRGAIAAMLTAGGGSPRVVLRSGDARSPAPRGAEGTRAGPVQDGRRRALGSDGMHGRAPSAVGAGAGQARGSPVRASVRLADGLDAHGSGDGRA